MLPNLVQAPTITAVEPSASSVEVGKAITVNVTLTAPAGGTLTFETSPTAGGVTCPPTTLTTGATSVIVNCTGSVVGNYTLRATITSPAGNTATHDAASQVSVVAVSGTHRIAVGLVLLLRINHAAQTNLESTFPGLSQRLR